MKVRVKADYGQFYALVYGREIGWLKGRSLWFWRPALVGAGPTPGAALRDAGGLVMALERSAAGPRSRSEAEAMDQDTAPGRVDVSGEGER